jgi:type IV pilus assembly protein PilP
MDKEKHLIMRAYGYWLISIFLSIGLSGCFDPGMDDLIQEIEQVKQRKNPAVSPIPDFKLIGAYFYEVENMRDPFESLVDTLTENVPQAGGEQKKANCPTPDPYRVRIGLELVPLDSLQMVGTLQETNGQLWALVASKSDGTIQRVKVGDYIGENYGKIINISEDQIELVELHPDGQGCWMEGTTSIALPETQR